MRGNTIYDNFLQDQIKECMQSCESIWGDSLKYKVPDAVNEMKQLYGDLFDLQQEFAIYKESKTFYDENQGFESVLNHAENLKQQRSVQLAQMRQEELRKAAQRISPDEDIVIEESSSTAGLLCPLTNRLPIHPIVSRKCKHVYEKDKIFAYIQINGGGRAGVPCPMAGCNRNITINDLYEDEEINRRVNEARRSQSQSDEYQVL